MAHRTAQQQRRCVAITGKRIITHFVSAIHSMLYNSTSRIKSFIQTGRTDARMATDTFIQQKLHSNENVIAYRKQISMREFMSTAVLHKSPTSNKDHCMIENLLSTNDIYLERFKENVFFKKMLHFKSLSPIQQEIIFAWKERFAIDFQTIIYTRLAMSHDEIYRKMSLEHLQEEIGHDKMLSEQLHPEHMVMQDPIIEAILTWFTHKMIVLDNIEKMALMHLVLETSANFFYPWAHQNNIFKGHPVEHYVKLHAEADESHSKINTELLENHSSITYQRLHEVIERGWIMMESMLQRVLLLVNEAESEHK
jgi:hypothetical protein